MSFLIFIPARSASVRLKNKNFKIINKKPLIEHTIDFAKKLKIKDILVSSDSKKVKNICSKYDILTEYERPKKISRNKTQMFETVVHGVEWYKKNINQNIKYIILLQPTFPSRNIEVLKKFIRIFRKKKMNSITSISKLRIASSCLLISKNSRKFKLINSKGSIYKIDGNFYICSLDFLKKHKKFSKINETVFVDSGVQFPIDIDYKEDFIIAKNVIENEI